MSRVPYRVLYSQFDYMERTCIQDRFVMKINYIVFLNVLNKSLQDEGCDILSQYTELELTNASAEIICKQLEETTGVKFNYSTDASNPEIVSNISNYYCSTESQEQFHKGIANKTILKTLDIDGDGKLEHTLVATKDIEDMSNDKFRTKMTAIICIGVLIACFTYLFAVTFGASFIDPDNNARFVDQILSNINSVINMVVMFVTNIFFLNSKFARKSEKDKDEQSS